MIIDVTYMSGAGNIFAVVDNRKHRFDIKKQENLAKILCNMNELNEIRTEGLIVLSETQLLVDFESEFFNPDGTFDSMCGNGGRCAVYFAYKKKFIKTHGLPHLVKFFMAGQLYKGLILEKSVQLYFPKKIDVKQDVKIMYNGITISGNYAYNGAKHFFVNYDDIPNSQDIDFFEFQLEQFALPIRHNKTIAPNGINVSIFKINPDGKLLIRTFEKGVEKETGACGTGALAVAYFAVLNNQMSFPVTVIPTSRIPLIINAQNDSKGVIENLILEGDAVFTHSSKVEVPLNYLMY